MMALLSGSSNNLHQFLHLQQLNFLNLSAKMLCQTFSPNYNVTDILPEDGSLKTRKIQVNITCNQSKFYFFICSWEFCQKTRFILSQPCLRLLTLAIIKQLNLILPQSHLGSNILRPSDPDTRHYLQKFAHVQKGKLKVQV